MLERIREFHAKPQSRKERKVKKQEGFYRRVIEFQNEQDCPKQLGAEPFQGEFKFCISFTQKNLQVVSFLTLAALRLCAFA